MLDHDVEIRAAEAADEVRLAVAAQFAVGLEERAHGVGVVVAVAADSQAKFGDPAGRDQCQAQGCQGKENPPHSRRRPTGSLRGGRGSCIAVGRQCRDADPRRRRRLPFTERGSNGCLQRIRFKRSIRAVPAIAGPPHRGWESGKGYPIDYPPEVQGETRWDLPGRAFPVE